MITMEKMIAGYENNTLRKEQEESKTFFRPVMY